jgi:ABC-type Mn2+/Zn2+ transport system ATPase subunit
MCRFGAGETPSSIQPADIDHNLIHNPINLYYYRTHSLPSDLPSSSIHDRIDKTLAELGLSDVSHHRIGNAIQRGISGGQKRRVTLGAALVTMPRILILDEPTSGLDSRAGWEVMRAGEWCCAPSLFVGASASDAD